MQKYFLIISNESFLELFEIWCSTIVLHFQITTEQINKAWQLTILDIFSNIIGIPKTHYQILLAKNKNILETIYSNTFFSTIIIKW